MISFRYALTQTTVETFSFEVGNVEKLTKFYLTFFTDPSYKSSTEFLLFARGALVVSYCTTVSYTSTQIDSIS